MTEQQPKPKIFELDRFTLWTGVEGGKRATMSFSTRDGFPRVNVFTRTESDANSKLPITVAFDLEHWLIMLSLFETMVRSDQVNVKQKAVTKYPPKDNRGGAPEPAAELWYGKDEEGVCWISAQSPGRPKIVFKIELSNFHEFVGTDGKTITAGRGSQLRTMGFIHVLRTHFTNSSVSFRDVSIPRPDRPGFNKGGNKAQGTAASDRGLDVSDDIPY